VFLSLETVEFRAFPSLAPLGLRVFLSLAPLSGQQAFRQLLQVITMKEALEVLKPQLVQTSKDTDVLLATVECTTAEAAKVKAVVSVTEAVSVICAFVECWQSLQVNTMKEALEVLKPQLVQASKDTDVLLATVERDTAEADKVKAVVSVDEAVAKGEADKVSEIKRECEADLEEAMPALNAAIKALDTLTKNDITEVKGMKSPPAAVKMVLEAVCIIKGLKATKVCLRSSCSASLCCCTY
jgi:hypothetical protein